VPTRYQARLQERCAARPESIAPLRRRIVAYAGDHGASQRQLEDIALAVSEAVSNAVIHAYVGRDPGDVGVDAWVAERRLHVVVSDDGRGMRPRPDSPGLRMGLSLIGLVAERLQLENRMTADGVSVRMTFAIG
jgi:anti-sigma regulatory factor (Ser/Thr protein kinase)